MSLSISMRPLDRAIVAVVRANRDLSPEKAAVLVRAVLKELREPGDTVQEGWLQIDWQAGYDSERPLEGNTTYGDVLDAWQAMVDAILEGKG